MELGVAPGSVHHVPNWSRVAPPALTVEQTRLRFGWDDGRMVVLHAGNMGYKQGLEQVVEAARLAADRGDPVRFVLAGGGNRAEAIREAASGLPNVDFLGVQPDGIHASLLAAADVLLLSERASQVDMSLPSKLTSYFAAGRPVVAAVAADGATAAEIERSGGGIVAPVGRPERLLDALRALRDDADLAGRLGRPDGRTLQPIPRPPCASNEQRGSWTRSPAAVPDSCRQPHDPGSGAPEGADHRDHRPGRLVPGRAAAGQGLRGPRPHPPQQLSSTPSGSTTSTVDPHEAETRLFLHYADLTDSSSLIGHLHRIKPAEVYNLGAQSHVKVSFEMPEFTAETAAMGTLRMLEAVRTADWPIRFYQAGSSEMYGKVLETPQRETTPFNPRSPYAVAKVFAHFITIDYREAYGLHASNGILFNHESPRRGGTFVTRKVTRGVAAILAGTQEHLFLGNLDAQRDWGYAKEYVEAMWLMLQQPEPGRLRDRDGRDALRPRAVPGRPSALVDLDWERYVRVDERYFRPDGGGGAVRRCLEGETRAGMGGADDVPGPRAPDAGARPG